MIRSIPATRETPAEYWSTAPINCTVCGQEWDADDHEGDEFYYHTISENPVCFGRCDEIETERYIAIEEEDELEQVA